MYTNSISAAARPLVAPHADLLPFLQTPIGSAAMEEKAAFSRSQHLYRNGVNPTQLSPCKPETGIKGTETLSLGPLRGHLTSTQTHYEEKYHGRKSQSIRDPTVSNATYLLSHCRSPVP